MARITLHRINESEFDNDPDDEMCVIETTNRDKSRGRTPDNTRFRFDAASNVWCASDGTFWQVGGLFAPNVEAGSTHHDEHQA